VGARIARDIIESYLHCRLKAHLKLAGNQGIRSDYEGFLLQTGRDVRQQVISKIFSKTSRDDVASNIPLTVTSLRAGSSYVLGTILEDDLLSLSFDGLKRVDGHSGLGDFHYVPMLFHEARTLGKDQNLLLEVMGLLLSQVQGKLPAHGIVWHGRDCNVTKVRLNADTRRSQNLLRELKEMASTSTPPSLLLNKHCPVCEFRQRCHDQAVQEDNLSLLRGMGEKELKSYVRKGIFTVTQLSYTFRPRRRPKWARAAPRPHSFALQALALRENTIYIHGSPDLKKSAVSIYLDIEGVPDDDFYYLIGVLIDDGLTQQMHSFWADSKDEQGHLITQLVQLLTQYTNYTLYHFGNYENKALKALKTLVPDELRQPLEEIQRRSVNVLSTVHAAVYVPTLANTLKNIAGFLGFHWTDAQATGLDSIVWRCRWETTHDDSLKERLLRYNQEDCLALKVVTDFVASLSREHDPELSPALSTLPDVVNTSELQRNVGRSHRFGKISFVFPELDFVNKCAYFDYQREKVYVRTSKSLHVIQKAKRRARRTALRPNTQIELLAKRCPYCGSRKLDHGRKVSRVVIDLKFFNKGVKRWLTRYESNKHECLKCRAAFLPESFPTSKQKYGHGLKCWFIFQNIIGGQNVMKITSGATEIFGLAIPSSYHRFKKSLVDYYQETYETLLKSILAGTLMHIDETEVIIKGKPEKGCVWVVTSMQAVYYFYKESRKALFLEEMLQGFSGVVVSDFFTAYDTLKCPQQKCVIHLLRDINEDLMKSPFDQELRDVVQPFAALFRSIIETVDKYGLKRRHLHKHRRQADEFLQSVREKKLTSDFAVKYQSKFAKYGDRLFTFLDHEGVPWNNNNAEHAVKRFVKYRRHADGRFTEKSLGHHLVLLSVLESCEYKNLPVLRFLLSRATELSLSAMRQAERLSRATRSM
jgi:predicted RecB family nuclease